MIESVDEFFAPVLADLQEAAGLLDPGLAPRQSLARRADAPGTLGGLLEDIDRLSTLVPRLIHELEADPTHAETVLEHAPIPRRPQMSKSARDYVRHEDTMVPKTWFNPVPVLAADSRPLAYVAWLVDRLDSQLAERHRRLQTSIHTALLDRENVDSVFARDETAELRATEDSIEQGRADLRRSTARLRRHAGGQLGAHPRRPTPYPSGQAWTSLRRLADLIEHPGIAMLRDLRASLHGPVHVADRGFLFQRWVGLKILAILEHNGWQIHGDKIGALLLGGELELRRGTTRVRFFAEPRLLTDDRHTSGLRARTSEQTPDFVFLTPGPHGQDAFVLDPTLSAATDHLAKKDRYLDLIEFIAPARIAGVPVRRPPRRAWSVAPSRRSVCDLRRRDGACGSIPVWPIEFHDGPLRSWLNDIETHADAWQT